MKKFDTLTAMELIDEKYIREANDIQKVFGTKKAFDYFWVGFLCCLILSSQVFLQLGIELVPTLVIQAVGLVVITVAGAKFYRQYSQNNYMLYVRNLSFLLSLIWGIYILFTLGTYLTEIGFGHSFGVYIPVRIMRILYILQDLTVLLFAAGCSRWMREKQQQGKDSLLKIYPYVYSVAYLILKILQYLFQEIRLSHPKGESVKFTYLSGLVYRFSTEETVICWLILGLNLTFLVYIGYLSRRTGE